MGASPSIPCSVKCSERETAEPPAGIFDVNNIAGLGIELVGDFGVYDDVVLGDIFVDLIGEVAHFLSCLVVGFGTFIQGHAFADGVGGEGR